MWKWTCPRVPKLTLEHHSAKSARLSIVLHVLAGNPVSGLPGCDESHILVDDGVPCDHPTCDLHYDRER